VSEPGIFAIGEKMGLANTFEQQQNSAKFPSPWTRTQEILPKNPWLELELSELFSAQRKG